MFFAGPDIYHSAAYLDLYQEELDKKITITPIYDVHFPPV